MGKNQSKLKDGKPALDPNSDQTLATQALSFNKETIYSKGSNTEKVTVDDFKILKMLGHGNFAKVLLVKKKSSGAVYAMKILNKKKLLQTDQLEHTKTERALLQYMQHPFLIELAYAFQTEEKLYMVMEFCSGGELFYHLKQEKKFSPSRVRFYAAELFLGLSHLHSHNVVYRDLKPENLLLSREGHVKLVDFGLAKILNTPLDRTNTFCGTPEYLAPEILLQKGHSKPVDWWSYGTFVFEMLVGIPPFYSENVQEMYDNILHSELYFPDFIDDTTQDFLSKLLTRDPAKRLGTKDEDEIKNHPYFKDMDWKKLYNLEIKPEYVPDVKGVEDTTLFEEEFTNQPAQDSLPSGSQTLGQTLQKEFDGFTFGDESILQDE